MVFLFDFLSGLTLSLAARAQQGSPENHCAIRTLLKRTRLFLFSGSCCLCTKSLKAHDRPFEQFNMQAICVSPSSPLSTPVVLKDVV